MRSTIVFGALLLASTAASVHSAAVVPSLEVNERGNIVLTVAKGAQVLLKTVDPDVDVGLEGLEGNDGEPIVTLSMMEASLAALKADLLDQISTKTATSVFNALSDTVESAAKAVTTIQEDLQNTVNDVDTLTEAGNGAAACMANIVSKIGSSELGQCPSEAEPLCDPTTDPLGGTAHGSARSPGATRTYTCNEGLTINGNAHSFCTKDLKWFPPAPSCTALVTCNFRMANELVSVFVDGTEVTTSLHHTQKGFYTAQFPSTARSLGLYGNSDGDSATRGWYIRIDGLAEKDRVINLAEVQAYDADGNLLKASTATFSKTHSAQFAGTKCINDDVTTRNEFCHSTGSNPWMRIEYGRETAIAKVVVTNRIDCCKQRIEGATISITTDPEGEDVFWSANLRGIEDKYTFDTGIRSNGCAWGGVAAYCAVDPALETASPWNNIHTGMAAADGTHAWKAISSKTPSDDGDDTWAAPDFDDSAWPKSVWAPYQGDKRCLAVGEDDPRTLLSDDSIQSSYGSLDASDRPKGQYIRIDNVATLNLAEIQAFDSDGNLIKASHALMNTWLAQFPASMCVDGNLGFNDDSNLCHTNGGTNPWLQIDYGKPVAIAKIVVYNRAANNCCGDRIVGARIVLSTGPDANDVVWGSSFTEKLSQYTFDIGSPTCVGQFCTEQVCEAMEQDGHGTAAMVCADEAAKTNAKGDGNNFWWYRFEV